jgi:hypothetical protein
MFWRVAFMGGSRVNFKHVAQAGQGLKPPGFPQAPLYGEGIVRPGQMLAWAGTRGASLAAEGALCLGLLRRRASQPGGFEGCRWCHLVVDDGAEGD